MNKNDSERMAGMLENLGYEETEDWRDANLVVVNTCSIRDRAERRALGQFQILHHHRRKHGKDMELAIAGCMPQHSKNFLLEQVPYLNYLVGVNNMERLPEFIKNKPPLKDQIGELLPHRRKEAHVRSFEEKLGTQKRISGHKAWVSITFGCDKFCTYCIVPFTRGREMSRKRENIFKEIAGLKEKTIDHVVLLGQNVNSYGHTVYRDYDFSRLLEDVATRFPWLRKIDFITSHPKDVNKRLIDVIARHENISREIHFPLQHGDDEILERMNRGYTLREYEEKVACIRKTIPRAKIGTDLIVGFPGETRIHFENMLSASRRIEFDYANTAVFSPRPGTKAARMEEQVETKEKKYRLQILNRTLDEIYQNKGSVRPGLG